MFKKILVPTDASEIQKERIDLVIMGSRGYGPLFGSIMGSVSQRVLNGAHCPVLIVN